MGGGALDPEMSWRGLRTRGASSSGSWTLSSSTSKDKVEGLDSGSKPIGQATNWPCSLTIFVHYRVWILIVLMGWSEIETSPSIDTSKRLKFWVTSIP